MRYLNIESKYIIFILEFLKGNYDNIFKINY